MLYNSPSKEDFVMEEKKNQIKKKLQWDHKEPENGGNTHCQSS
jgi:hypothetical protein